MLYQISSDNIDLTESMGTLAREKLSKLERFFEDFAEDAVTARAVLNRGSEEDTFEVSLELTIPRKKYFTEERDYSLESALIKVVSEIERQLEKTRSENEKAWETRREMKSAEGLEEYVEEV